jgi:hypothetical protein
MTANRRYLYWGAFFIALGGVMVAVDRGAVDASAVVDAVRWWPLLLVATGAALVLRRTRYSLAAWLVAATLPGLLVGGALATGPRLALDCIDGGRPILISQGGTLDAGADVSVVAGCGNLRVDAASGSLWRVEPGDPGDATATVASSGASLSIDAGRTGRWHGGMSRGATWRVTLPTSAIEELRLEVDAGEGTIDLAGARIDSLTLAANAAQTSIDLSRASLAELSARLMLGAMTIRLPDADLDGSLEVGLGELRVCLPRQVGLRVERRDELGVVKYQGFEQRARVWQSPGYDQATHHVDLRVSTTLGGVEFDPIGTCP